MHSNKKLYDVEEVLTIIPMSRSGLYLACSRGEIPKVKVGRRLFIPAWWIDEMVNRPNQQAG